MASSVCKYFVHRTSDHLIKSYVRTFNINATISNCCNNYGPGQFPEKLIPTLIYNILKNKNLPIYGKGINSREWIHVEDHCRGLLLILKSKVEKAIILEQEKYKQS